MEYFPMFLDIENKPVLICGSSRHALEKIHRLAPYRPRITLIASAPTPELKALTGITLAPHRFCEADLACHPVFVVTAESPEENRRISQICRAHHIPVNAVDQQEDCDFLFPALLKAGPLSAGISTSGASPTAAMELRDQFRELVPTNIEEILAWLLPTRARIFCQVEDKKLQRTTLREVVREAFALDRTLTDGEVSDILAHISR